MNGISVFFPAYNDAPSIGPLVRKAFAVLSDLGLDFEVIVVNDGSYDDTGRVLESLRDELGPQLRIVTHPVNRGYGGALRSGFFSATKNLIFYTDGDGQYDVGELPKLLDAMGPEVGLVNGFKLERNDPAHRIWIGNAYNRFAKAIFGIRLQDVDCDFRLVRRHLIEQIELTSTSGVICVELVRKLELSGCRVVEVGVHHYPRLHGRSQFFRVRSLLSTLYQMIRLWIRLWGYQPLAAPETYANPVR